jgi:predicted GH43/DUF377 family glycosyl hydrolase
MKWKKLGQVFNPQIWNDGFDREWMNSHAQCTSTLIFDDFVRVYFSSRYSEDENNQSTSVTAFLDLDRNNLKNILRVANKPVLSLGGLGSFDENAIYPTSVIRHENTVRLYYAGWSRCKSVPFNTSIGMAISNDNGVTFKRYSNGPIISASMDEPFVISGPKVRRFENKWFLYYLAGKRWINHNGKPEIIYKNRMATSLDGITWTKENRDILTDILDENECQAGPDVFELNGLYHMYFAYREGLDFREKTGRGYKIGYAVSDDKYNWTRKDKEVGISYSKNGWDSTMHHYPHVFELDGNFYMLYNGNDFGKYGFGLAILSK